MMGFVVDVVFDVLSVYQEEIKVVFVFGVNIFINMIEGLVNVGDSVVMLLLIDQFLDLEDL